MREVKRGFTLPEIVVAVAFFLILLSLVTINLVGARRQVAKGGNLDVLIADIKEQQAKAMSAQGTIISDYGIHLESNKYTLFIGGSYDPNAVSNFSINLDDSVTLTNITFPSSNIIFSRGSGEMAGYSALTNSFKINVLGSEQSVSFNKLGTVTINE